MIDKFRSFLIEHCALEEFYRAVDYSELCYGEVDIAWRSIISATFNWATAESLLHTTTNWNNLHIEWLCTCRDMRSPAEATEFIKYTKKEFLKKLSSFPKKVTLLNSIKYYKEVT